MVLLVLSFCKQFKDNDNNMPSSKSDIYYNYLIFPSEKAKRTVLELDFLAKQDFHNMLHFLFIFFFNKF